LIDKEEEYLDKVDQMSDKKIQVVVVKGGSQIDEKDRKVWEKIVADTIDEQANAFLKAFVEEFSGTKFEEVLDIGQQFKKYTNPKSPELDEKDALLFLEKRGETLTATKLRELLKEIDVDNNNKVSFLEYCLFKWGKKPATFFIELAKPKKGGEALMKAIEEYRKILAAKEARAAKMADLEKQSQGEGVKAKTAAAQLAQMKSEDQLAMNKAEITAGAKKRYHEKNAVDPYEEEKKRMEADKKKKRKRKRKRNKTAKKN